MIELKIKDVESLEAIVTALHKNDYFCTSYIHWGKNGIDHFTVQFEAPRANKNITPESQNALKEIGKKAHGGE